MHNPPPPLSAELERIPQSPSPDLLALPHVIEGEEYVGVLADGVVGEALQADKQVVWHWDSAHVTMTLAHTVALVTRQQATVISS